MMTLAVGLLLAAGEIARWWGDPRFFPLAFDELLIASAMVGAALMPGRFGATGLAVAWGGFCGLALALLVPTLDHLMHGPPKDSAGFYAIVLAAMLIFGLAATGRALSLCRRSRR